MTGAAPALGHRWRGRTAVAAAVALLIVTGLVIGAPASEAPLDPDAVGPDGLRGLVELLGQHGIQTDVSLDPPNDLSTRALVPIDRLTEPQRAAWLAWVESGGHLVVTDPASELHGLTAEGGAFVDTIGATSRAPACPALPEVDTITHADWVGFAVPPQAAATCFPLDDEHAWLVAQGRGAGAVIALGSASVLTNAQLDRDDHAVLAAALLAPAPGDRLRIVPRPPVGAGDTALVDLVAPRVWHGLAILTTAVVVGAVAVGRRFGRPVDESLPPVLPASELARSVAHLLQSAGRPETAARSLRQDARTAVAAAAGLAPDTPPGELLTVAQQRLMVPEAAASTALLDAPVTDASDLLGVQAAVREVRARARGRWV